MRWRLHSSEAATPSDRPSAAAIDEMVRVCGDCGFDFSAVDDDAAIAVIDAAGPTFAVSLRRCGADPAAPGAARSIAGWSPAGHVAHVASTFDAARVDLVNLAMGKQLPPEPHVEAPLAGEWDLRLDEALVQLEAASAWLVCAVRAVPPAVRDSDAGRRLLRRGAHEVTHHARMLDGEAPPS